MDGRGHKRGLEEQPRGLSGLKTNLVGLLLVLHTSASCVGKIAKVARPASGRKPRSTMQMAGNDDGEAEPMTLPYSL